LIKRKKDRNNKVKVLSRPRANIKIEVRRRKIKPEAEPSTLNRTTPKRTEPNPG